MTTYLHQAHQSSYCCRSHLRHGKDVLPPACASIRHALRVRHRVRRRTAQRKRTLCKPRAHSLKCENVPPGASPVPVLLPKLRAVQLLRRPQAWQPPTQAAPPSCSPTRRRSQRPALHLQSVPSTIHVRYGRADGGNPLFYSTVRQAIGSLISCIYQ